MIEVEHSNEMDDLTLITKNTDALILGSPTKEGGDVRIYRDGSNNLALFIDADAASNTKGLDFYAGILFRNNVVIGRNTFSTVYKLLVDGTSYFTGDVYLLSDFRVNNGKGIVSSLDNITSMILGNIRISGTDVIDHTICMQMDSTDIFCIQATGDGAGGIVDLKAIIKKQLVYTPSSDTAITAAGGITVTKAIMRVAGNGGAIDITADPQIAAGTDGQVVIIQGTHDTNTITLDDGAGLA